MTALIDVDQLRTFIAIAETGVHRSALARAASDHLPIWAELSLPG